MIGAAPGPLVWTECTRLDRVPDDPLVVTTGPAQRGDVGSRARSPGSAPATWWRAGVRPIQAWG